MAQRESKLIAYWLATIAAAGLFAIPGSALLARAPQFVAEMGRLGYPTYFLAPFGALKVAGALIILAPRLPRAKEWAYAGMAFDTAFATYSRAAIGDPPLQVLAPLVIATLVLASWAMRPPARRLVNPTLKREFAQ